VLQAKGGTRCHADKSYREAETDRQTKLEAQARKEAPCRTRSGCPAKVIGQQSGSERQRICPKRKANRIQRRCRISERMKFGSFRFGQILCRLLPLCCDHLRPGQAAPRSASCFLARLRPPAWFVRSVLLSGRRVLHGIRFRLGLQHAYWAWDSACFHIAAFWASASNPRCALVSA